jgi:hypothetical protein
MDTLELPVATVIALALFASGAAQESQPRIPSSISGIVQRADRIESFRLAWGYTGGDSIARLDRYPIVAVGPVLDSQQSAFLKPALLTPEHNEAVVPTEGVFTADVGFRFTADDSVVTAVLDYHEYTWLLAAGTSRLAAHFGVIKPEMKSFAIELFPNDGFLASDLAKSKALPWREYDSNRLFRD